MQEFQDTFNTPSDWRGLAERPIPDYPELIWCEFYHTFLAKSLTEPIMYPCSYIDHISFGRSDTFLLLRNRCYGIFLWQLWKYCWAHKQKSLFGNMLNIHYWVGIMIIWCLQPENLCQIIWNRAVQYTKQIVSIANGFLWCLSVKLLLLYCCKIVLILAFVFL